MSEVLVDGRLRLVVEPDRRISFGPGWQIVVVDKLELIIINQSQGIVFVPAGTDIQAYGEVLPPLPPPPLMEGSVIDAGQTRGPQG